MEEGEEEEEEVDKAFISSPLTTPPVILYTGRKRVSILKALKAEKELKRGKD
jgi:hypothetical protein